MRVTFDYDEAGRPVTRRGFRNIPGSWKNEDAAEFVTYSYDDDGQSPYRSPRLVGRLAAVRDASGVAFRDYDSYGRPSALAKSFGTESDLYVTAFGYRRDGAVTSITYDPPGSAADETVSYDYDSAGWLSGISSSYGGVIASYDQYDDVGRIQHVTYDKGAVQRSYSYRPRTGWLDRTTVSVPGGTPFLDLFYRQYDDGGNVVAIDDYSGMKTDSGEVPAKYAFQYDLLDRLTRATATPSVRGGQSYSYTYTYNSLGNMSGEKDEFAGALRTYNGLVSGALPDAVCNVNGPVDTTDPAKCAYQYDVRGNLAQERDNAGAVLRNFSYFADGRLRRVETATKFALDHTYDGLGGVAILSQTANGGTPVETRLVGGLMEVTNGVVRKHYFGLDRVGVREGGVSETGAVEPVKYYHADHLGSTRVATADAVPGNVLETLGYLPFGAIDPKVSTPAPDARYQYTGQRAEEGAGLMLFAARHYDPTLKRFIQPDWLSLAGGGLNARDAFGYVSNNPINRIDPTGLDDCLGKECGGLDWFGGLFGGLFGGGGNSGGGSGGLAGRGQGDASPAPAASPQSPMPPGHGAMGGGHGGELLFAQIVSMPLQYQVSAAKGFYMNLPRQMARLAAAFDADPAGVTAAMIQQNMNPVSLAASTLDGYTARIRGSAAAGGWYGGFMAGSEIGGENSLLLAGVAGGAPAGAARGGGGAYEILDGVRRAKAAEIAGQEAIEAEVVVGDRIVEVRSIRLADLRSPYKDMISTAGAGLDRWLNTPRLTLSGSKPPPIKVNPGSRGRSIHDVTIE